MTSSLLLGGIVGFLLGLLICYWNQIKTVYQHKDVIGAGSDLITAGQNFWNQVQKV